MSRTATAEGDSHGAEVVIKGRFTRPGNTVVPSPGVSESLRHRPSSQLREASYSLLPAGETVRCVTFGERGPRTGAGFRLEQGQLDFLHLPKFLKRDPLPACVN